MAIMREGVNAHRQAVEITCSGGEWVLFYGFPGRLMLSLLRQRLKLLGVKPITDAAPRGPSTLQPVLASVSRKHSRSNSRNFTFSANRSLC